MTRNLPSADSSVRQRLPRLRAAFAKASRLAKIDCFLVTRPQDVQYLTGFTGEDSFLLAHRRGGVLITDGRFDEQAHAECPGVEVFVRTGAMTEAVAQVARQRRLRRIGVQGGHMTLSLRDSLERTGAFRRILSLGEAVGELRVTKDDAEIAVIRKAIRVAERALAEMLALGRKGWVARSERELAAELDHRMRLAGASGPAFETIVAVDSHGSLPHYRPGGKRLGSDGLVLVDWGARVGGYCSDLTRVVRVGRIPPRLTEVYDVVLRAQQAGIEACRAGVAAASVDRAARGVIEAAGYGKQFVHGLGHGIGLEIHEGPSLGRTAKTRLRPGMVVTIEPGIYLPGVGGVRIEDDVVVVRGGCRRLSSLPRDLQSMTVR
jgi:Xaa-Pro aminopeptidase